MPDLIFLLSLFLGILSVANKILLARNRRSGWMSGILIGLLSCVYFYFAGLRILAAAEFGFFFVMLYGYLQYDKRSSSRDHFVSIVLTFLLVGVSVFLFSGALTVLELVSSLSFIWGGYALALGKKLSGWLLLLSAHLSTSLASYEVGQLIFSSLQILSAMICVFALIELLRRTAPQ